MSRLTADYAPTEDINKRQTITNTYKVRASAATQVRLACQ